MSNNYDSAVALTKTQCSYCGEIADGDLVMNTRLTKHVADQVREMHGKVTDFKTCDQCQGALDQGAVFLVEIDPDKSEVVSNGTDDKLGSVNFESAYRTGRVWALKEEALRDAIIDVEITEQRMIFIDEQAARKLLGPMYDSQQTGE